MPITKLRQKIDAMKGERSSHWAKASELVNKAETEQRSFTPEEQVQYREFIAKMDALKNDIEIQETQLRNLIEMEGEAGEKIIPQVGEGTGEARSIEETPEYRNSFFDYARGRKSGDELRAMSKTGGEGVLVPTTIETKFYKYLNDFSVMRRVSSIVTLGTDKTYIMMDDTGLAGWIDEGGTYGETDDTFKSKGVSAYKVGRIVKISKELLQDSIENMEDYIAKSLARSIAKAENAAYTKGRPTDKEKQPRGFIHDATIVNSASSSAIILDEVKALKFKVHSDAVVNGKYMMHKDTAEAISILKDATQNYYWQPSVKDGEPDKLFGKPVEINNDMDVIGAGKAFIAFGDFGSYQVTDRKGFTMQRLNELYATTGQVGFLADTRTDGILMFDEAIAVLKGKE